MSWMSARIRQAMFMLVWIAHDEALLSLKLIADG